MATAFRPAMTGYHLTNLNNCKLFWKLCNIMAFPALTSVSVCWSVGQLSAQPVIVLLAFMWVSPAVFDLACVSVICVCACLFCMPLFILRYAELIVRCGPHKSVYGNSSQSSHLSSFHASPSSSACVVRRVSVSLCVRFCIKICCFIMEWLSFFLFVFESVCVCSELIQAFLWKGFSQKWKI